MNPLEENHSLLHSFCVRPDIKFANQKADEEVLLSLRAHPITILPALFNTIVIFILIFFMGFIIGQFLNPVQSLYTIVFLYFVTFLYFWFQIINWYFNIGIVTNLQVLDVDFNALTFRHVTRTKLTSIEDISVKLLGFISSIFNYGNIFIQTAGSEINTEFLNVPNPTKAANIIQDIIKYNGSTH